MLHYPNVVEALETPKRLPSKGPTSERMKYWNDPRKQKNVGSHTLVIPNLYQYLLVASVAQPWRGKSLLRYWSEQIPDADVLRGNYDGRTYEGFRRAVDRLEGDAVYKLAHELLSAKFEITKLCRQIELGGKLETMDKSMYVPVLVALKKRQVELPLETRAVILNKAVGVRADVSAPRPFSRGDEVMSRFGIHVYRYQYVVIVDTLRASVADGVRVWPASLGLGCATVCGDAPTAYRLVVFVALSPNALRFRALEYSKTIELACLRAIAQTGKPLAGQGQNAAKRARAVNLSCCVPHSWRQRLLRRYSSAHTFEGDWLDVGGGRLENVPEGLLPCWH